MLLGALLLGPLGACSLPDFMSFPPQVRGNRIDADQLKELVPGVTTRTDVAAAIGTPTARAAFDDNTWLYISEITKPVIGATNEIRDQQVVVMKFDQGGVLRSIERKGADDGLPVTVATRTTPAPGSEASFMQQLLGNVGKFSPGTGGNNSAGAGRGVSGAY